MKMQTAKRVEARSIIIAIAAICVLWGLSIFRAQAFECDNSALEDRTDYYCGNDRGSYVLQPNGVSLWVSADGDDWPIVKVREPAAGGLMERILVQFNDVVAGQYIGGIGSNPHINASGESIVQASLSTSPSTVAVGWEDRAGGRPVVMLVSEAGGSVEVVAQTGAAFGTETAVCGDGLQPWPFMGDGGDYVFAAVVRDAEARCGYASDGDADTESGNLCETIGGATANTNAVAKVTRVEVSEAVPFGSDVPGCTTSENNSVCGYKQPRTVTVYFEQFLARTITQGDLLGIRLPRDSAESGGCELGEEMASITASNNWDHSVPGEISAVFANSYTLWSVCGVGACDFNLSQAENYIWKENSGRPRDEDMERATASSGVRAIARGKVGGAAPQTILRAVNLPRYANEVQTSVSASVAAGVEMADHPLLSAGAVTHWLRRADAITFTSNMVGPDGSVVIRVGTQAAPVKIVHDGYLGTYLNRDEDGQNRGGWNTMVLHIDPTGAARVAGNADLTFKHLSGVQITSDNGALYRAWANSRDEDIEPSPTVLGSNISEGMVISWSSSGETTGDVPTGSDSAIAGVWYPDTMDLWDTNNDVSLEAKDCDGQYKECSIAVATDDPASASDWHAMIFSEDTYAPDVKAVIEAGDAALRVQTDHMYEAMLIEAPVGADLTYALFPLPSDAFTSVNDPTMSSLVTWPLELKKWTQSDGVQTVFANGDVSPGGFSRLRGIPKHYHENGGVIAARTALQTPYLGSAGGVLDNPYPILDESSETQFLATILGDAAPCEATFPDFSGVGGVDYSQFENIGPYSSDPCDAIIQIVDGSVTEIARTKSAEFVFAQGDLPTATGVSGVEGFSFVEFGAAVAVSETGTVFFNAMTRDEGVSGCDNEDILDDQIRDGVFAYRDGVVEKVIAEGDVISSGGSDMFVNAISLPQPELRGGVAGDSIMLKMAVDTDGDCIEDTVGLVQATAPSAIGEGDDSILYTPDKGGFASIINAYAGEVRLTNASPENGWLLGNFRARPDSDKVFLSDDQVSGGFYSFQATWCKDANGDEFPEDVRPDICDEEDPVVPRMDLTLTMRIPPAQLLDIAKDLVETPSLLNTGTVEETPQGLKVTLSIEDNGQFDLNEAPHELLDPFGAQVLRAIFPAIPVPLFGQGLVLLLSGLMSLLGGVFAWRRRET